MREILFRGRKTDDEKWVYGFYVHLYSIGKDMKTHRIYDHFAATDCGDFYPDWYEVDAATVGQYTGLQDKNGKWIFEGDICRNTKTGEIVSVKWHGTMAGFVGHKLKENSHLYDFGELFRAYDKYEVIGNIHDNPELLEPQE